MKSIWLKHLLSWLRIKRKAKLGKLSNLKRLVALEIMHSRLILRKTFFNPIISVTTGCEIALSRNTLQMEDILHLDRAKKFAGLQLTAYHQIKHINI